MKTNTANQIEKQTSAILDAVYQIKLTALKIKRRMGLITKGDK